MCDTDNEIQGMRTGLHDAGHGFDHVFEAFPAVDETEGANHLTAREPESALLCVVALAGDHRDPMRNDLHLWSGYAVNVLEKPGCHFRHDDQTLALGREFPNNAPRKRSWLGHQRVERGDDRLAAATHE